MTVGSDADGITVREISPMHEPVHWRQATRAAFVGRALRGPLNKPVLVDSLATFTRRFGGRWKRGSLYDAVEQFFRHGGRELYVVRVANGADGALLELPGPDGSLRLTAREPGSSEVLRASVDYDGVTQPDRFNLVVQRLAPATRLVIDQEIFPNISCDPASRAFVADRLLNATLVQLETPVPGGRPYATMGQDAGGRPPYVEPSRRGSDGGALSDYDLIGSSVRGTGLHALDAAERFELLYLPPLAPDRDPGPAALLAAERYCRRRGAMLITDPDPAWREPRDAVNGLREAGLGSASLIGYFPRLVRDDESLPAGAAVAGLLCKLDERHGPWANIEAPGNAFNRGLKPLYAVDERGRELLRRAGLNAIAMGTDGRYSLMGGVTMAAAAPTEREFASLPVRRLCLLAAGAIERASRWAVFEPDRQLAVLRVESQVQAFLEELAAAGAITTGNVRCESTHDRSHPAGERGLNIVLALTPADGHPPVSLSLYHTPSACRVTSTAFGPALGQSHAA